MALSLIRHPLSAVLKTGKQFGKIGYKPAFGSAGTFKAKTLAGRYPAFLTKPPKGVAGRGQQVKGTFPGALDLRLYEPVSTGRPDRWGMPKMSTAQRKTWMAGRKRWKKDLETGYATTQFEIRPATGTRAGHWEISATDSPTLGKGAIGYVEMIRGPYWSTETAAGLKRSMASYENTLGQTTLERRKNVKRLFGQAAQFLPPKIKVIEGQRATGLRSRLSGSIDTSHTRVPLPGRGLGMKEALASFKLDNPFVGQSRARNIGALRQRGQQMELPLQATPAAPVAASRPTPQYQRIESIGMGGTGGRRTLTQNQRLPSPERLATDTVRRPVPGTNSTQFYGYRVGSGPAIPAVRYVIAGDATFPARMQRRHYQLVASDLRDYLQIRFGQHFAANHDALAIMGQIAARLSDNSNFHRQRFVQAVTSGRDALIQF